MFIKRSEHSIETRELSQRAARSVEVQQHVASLLANFSVEQPSATTAVTAGIVDLIIRVVGDCKSFITKRMMGKYICKIQKL